MTITLPAEQGHFLDRLVAAGRFATRDEAIAEAVRRLETDEAIEHINPRALTAEEAEQIYAADAAWETVERSVAGRARPEV